ncbi:MAG: hypothetical protein J6R88_02925 [Clostridia bacterium]|nr:hypothetical protein [Clostridia bacterium]
MNNFKLNFEIVPTGAWNNNLRTVLSKKAWDFIRKDAYARANGKCSICNKPVKRLEAHEKWSYNKNTGVQKLEDVIAVCHACHSVIHIGRTQLLGFENDAINHFKRVNNCDYQGYIKALSTATEESVNLSTVDSWSLDLTWLQRFIDEK